MATGTGGRPLSPHLQIWRWHTTMLLSILHRATGIAWSGALILLTWWLSALAVGSEYFGFVHGIVQSWFGALVLFAATAVVFVHTLAGLRHLAWDAGFGFDPAVAKQTSLYVLYGAGALTVATWLFIIAIG